MEENGTGKFDAKWRPLPINEKKNVVSDKFTKSLNVRHSEDFFAENTIFILQNLTSNDFTLTCRLSKTVWKEMDQRKSKFVKTLRSISERLKNLLSKQSESKSWKKVKVVTSEHSKEKNLKLSLVKKFVKTLRSISNSSKDSKIFRQNNQSQKNSEKLSTNKISTQIVAILERGQGQTRGATAWGREERGDDATEAGGGNLHRGRGATAWGREEGGDDATEAGGGNLNRDRGATAWAFSIFNLSNFQLYRIFNFSNVIIFHFSEFQYFEFSFFEFSILTNFYNFVSCDKSKFSILFIHT